MIENIDNNVTWIKFDRNEKETYPKQVGRYLIVLENNIYIDEWKLLNDNKNYGWLSDDEVLYYAELPELPKSIMESFAQNELNKLFNAN